MNAMISTDGLSKRFGKVHAVDGVSLSVRKGEIYGFLGLNGAGKTTTIRMLLGMIRPTAGSARIGGRIVDAGNHALWNDVGYMVEIPYSYPDLTVRENLETVRRIRGVADPGAVDAIMGTLRLTEYAERLSRHLSQGNAQRLVIAKALIHDPGILILDEPANGLDPAGILEIRELLKDLASSRGVTVLISSHILGEISRFATRIGIIHEGRLVTEVDTDKLDARMEKRLVLEARDMEGAERALVRSGYAVARTDSGGLELREERAIARPDDVARLLVEAGVPPVMLAVREENLESFFLRSIGMNGGTR